MSAYFRKTKSNFATTLVTGIGTGTGDTITLNSTTGLPTDTEITLTFNRVTSDGAVNSTSVMERIRGTISGATLTSYTRGCDGTTEQAHAAAVVVEYIPNASDINDQVDGILVQHNQDGTHKAGLVTSLKATAAEVTTGTEDAKIATPKAIRDATHTFTSPKIVTAIADSGGNELLKLTATSLAVNELTLANAATTANPTITASGGDDNVGLDLKMKGTGVFRKPTTVGIQVFDSGISTSTGDGKAFFRVPVGLNGMNLVGVAMSVYTAGTTGTTDVQIRNKTDSQDMLSTKLTIDSTETDSSTAATAAVINASYDDVATGDILCIDVDAVHSGTAAKGLYVEMRFALP